MSPSLLAAALSMAFASVTFFPQSAACADGAGDEWEEVATQEQDQNAPEVQKSTKPTPDQAAAADALKTSSSTQVRRFHEVLDELLAEFGYDVKMGQIKGLKNVSVRKVEVSDALPRSYEEYVELLVSERIRENSRVRLINCIPCKTRTSTLVEGKLMITSPTTNLARMEQAATQLGIDTFMDVVLVYHSTHMVLAFSVFDTGTKEMVWARTYNSETIKSRYQKLAIDYSQVAKSRPGEDYDPEYRFLVGLGGGYLPNVGGEAKDKSFLFANFRGSEKFDNRRSEFGLMLSVAVATSSVLKAYPGTGTKTSSTTSSSESTEITPDPYKTALGLYGTYGHIFLGPIESYNQVRHGLHAGLGGLMSTGYLATSARVGWDIFFGRRFTATIGLIYVGSSNISVKGEEMKTKGGAGGDITLSLNF